MKVIVKKLEVTDQLFYEDDSMDATSRAYMMAVRAAEDHVNGIGYNIAVIELMDDKGDTVAYTWFNNAPDKINNGTDRRNIIQC